MVEENEKAQKQEETHETQIWKEVESPLQKIQKGMDQKAQSFEKKIETPQMVGQTQTPSK